MIKRVSLLVITAMVATSLSGCGVRARLAERRAAAVLPFDSGAAREYRLTVGGKARRYLVLDGRRGGNAPAPLVIVQRARLLFGLIAFANHKVKSGSSPL